MALSNRLWALYLIACRLSYRGSSLSQLAGLVPDGKGIAAQRQVEAGQSSSRGKGPRDWRRRAAHRECDRRCAVSPLSSNSWQDQEEEAASLPVPHEGRAPSPRQKVGQMQMVRGRQSGRVGLSEDVY